MRLYVKGVLAMLAVLLITFVACSCSSRSIDLDEYSIVYAQGAGMLVTDAVERLASVSSAKIADSSDDEVEHEILIGTTKRAASVAAFSEMLYLDYTIRYNDGKLVICGGSDKATADAVNCFIDTYIDSKGKKITVTDYTYKHAYKIKSVKVAGRNITSFNVISTVDNAAYAKLCTDFSERFTEYTGYRINEHAGALNVMIKCDSSLASNEYLIKVATGDITLSGANAYGIKAACEYFFDSVLCESTVLNDGDEFRSSIAQTELLYSDYINSREKLRGTHRRLCEDKKLNIVYFGGSVTSGYGASDAEQSSWRASCTEWFKQSFPDAEINAYDSSIGGSGSMLGAFRCEHDVNALTPDLVFVDLAVNDLYCQTSFDDVKLYYESIVRQIKTSFPDCDIIALYITDQSNATGDNGGMFDQLLAQEEIAKYYKLPSILLGNAACSRFDASNADEWSKYFVDIVHPNDDGYALYFDAIRELLETELIYDAPSEDEALPYALPEKLSSTDFKPRLMTADKLEIVENINWAFSESPYWNTANKYNGYIYPTDADNSITLRFKGEHAALFAEYGSENRLVYSFDANTERIQNQKGNHPLLLNATLDEAADEHTLTLSVNIKDESTPYMISALLVW